MKKNIATVLLLVIAVVAVVGIKKSQHAEAEAAASGCGAGSCSLPITQEETMPEGTSQEAPAAEDARPKLLDLGAAKCVPCKMMAPILDEMTETFAASLEVEFIDVWENPDAAKSYEIRMIPTQIFFDAEGKELFRHEGFFAREDMLAKWKELGFEFVQTAEQ